MDNELGERVNSVMSRISDLIKEASSRPMSKKCIASIGNIWEILSNVDGDVFDHLSKRDRWNSTLRLKILEFREDAMDYSTHDPWPDETWRLMHPSIRLLAGANWGQCAFYIGNDDMEFTWCGLPPRILCMVHTEWLVEAHVQLATAMIDGIARICCSFITPDYDRIVLLLGMKISELAPWIIAARSRNNSAQN